MLRDILNSKDEITNEFLFSLEDLSEVIDEEQIGDNSDSRSGISFTGRGSDSQGNDDPTTR